MAARRVVIEFLGDDKSASKTAKQVEQETSRLGRSMQTTSGHAGKLGGSLGTLGGAAMLGVAGGAVAAGAAVLKLGADSVNAEATFSQTMNTMAAVANVPKDQMKGLSDLALKMGADTTFSAGEAADAMLELAKGGLSSATIQGGALQGTLTLAAAGGTDLATAATIASNALNTFGLKGKDMASVAAALAGGANASSASVESLGQALSQVGPGATNAGLSLQDTVGTLSAFDAAGIKGADSGTSLKTMLTRLVPSTKAARNAMHDLGLKFTDANGKFVPITNVAQQLKDKLGKLSQEQRTTALSTIFGSDATRAATVLMNQGAAGLGKFIAATKDQNAAQNVAKARMDGTAGALESFKGSVETAKLQLGLFLAPVVQAGLKKMTEGLNAIVPGVKSLAGTLSTHLKPTMDEVLPKLKSVGTFVGQEVVPRLKQLGTYLMDTLIPAWVKIAKGALAGAKQGFDLVKKAIEENRPQLEKMTEKIGVIYKWIVEKLGPIMAWLAKTVFKLLGAAIAETITEVGRFVDRITWMIKTAKTIGKAFSDAWGAVKSSTGTLLKTIWGTISGFLQNILDGAAKAFGWVPGLGGKLKDAAKGFKTFRDDVNAKLAGITDQTITVTAKLNSANINNKNANDRRLAGAGRATGGPIFGPGSGTSDDVPIMASNGEHMLTAEEVRKAGGHGAIYQWRQALRAGLGHHAGGGAVGFDVRAGIPGAGTQSAFASGLAAGARAVALPVAQALANKLVPGGPPGSVQSFRGEKLNSRTISMLLAAEKILGHVFNIMQGSYSTRVAASGGTHSGGGAMDTDGPGGWNNAVSALRKSGFAAWHRTPAMGPWGHHIHSIAIGDSSASPGAKRQVQDYLRGGDGLGSYKQGTPYVPEDQLAFLHKGEKVIPAGAGTGVVININGALDPIAVAKQIQTILLNLKRTNGYINLGLA